MPVRPRGSRMCTPRAASSGAVPGPGPSATGAAAGGSAQYIWLLPRARGVGGRALRRSRRARREQPLGSSRQASRRHPAPGRGGPGRRRPAPPAPALAARRLPRGGMLTRISTTLAYRGTSRSNLAYCNFQEKKPSEIHYAFHVQVGPPGAPAWFQVKVGFQTNGFFQGTGGGSLRI